MRVIAPWFLDVPLDEIDVLLIEKFKQERKGEEVSQKTGKKVSDRTVNIGLSTLSHLFTYARRLNFIQAPLPEIRMLKVKDRRNSKALTHEKIKAVIQTATEAGDPWRAYVLFRLHTGCCSNEAREVLWSDIDFGQGSVYIRAENTKTGQPCYIPLLPEVQEALDALPRRLDFVFTHETWSRKKEKCRRGKIVQQIPNYSGSGRRRYPWDPPGMKVPAHQFRHTFATLVLQDRLSLSQVSALMGHSSVQVTSDLYGHVQPGKMIGELARMFRPAISVGRDDD